MRVGYRDSAPFRQAKSWQSQGDDVYEN
ncbi:hypothetical protein K388_06573, partial [Streptomyces sp. KhCrAH-43]